MKLFSIRTIVHDTVNYSKISCGEIRKSHLQIQKVIHLKETPVMNMQLFYLIVLVIIIAILAYWTPFTPAFLSDDKAA